MGNKLTSRVRTAFGASTKWQTPAGGIGVISRDFPLSGSLSQNNRCSTQLVPREDAKRFVDNELVRMDAETQQATLDKKDAQCHSSDEPEVVDILGNFTRVESIKMCASAHGDKKDKKQVYNV